MEENQIEEGEVLESSEEAEAEESVVADTPRKTGLKGFLDAISAAVAGEQITTAQAAQIRQQMGIGQGYFTRNRNSNAAKRKAKRKMQQASRKRNRGRVRGQKNNKGTRYRVN